MLWLGVALRVLGGALTHFSCKLGLINFFYRPGGAGAPTAPPGYAYACFMMVTPKCFYILFAGGCRCFQHSFRLSEDLLYAEKKFPNVTAVFCWLNLSRVPLDKPIPAAEYKTETGQTYTSDVDTD